MNIGLVINAKGKVCLVHDEPFEAVPVWVAYDVDSKRMKIIFDTGTDYPIDWEATDEIHYYLMKIGKILMIRMEDKKPIEGYDTSFVKYKNGKYFEDQAQGV
ncbi:MAG: hypothetical protein WBK91_00770 [Alphaproteobacteria bacterium]